MEHLLILSVEDTSKEVVRVAMSQRRRRKKRSGWRHALDLNRNRRRCEKRRRSASACARHALEMAREAEMKSELRESRRQFQVINRPRSERRPDRGLEPRRAW
jgi:hypothetical protein